VLQCVVACSWCLLLDVRFCRYSVMQCLAAFCSVLQCGAGVYFSMSVCLVAACCSVLQRVVVCCNVLQCVAACCSALQCVALHCSVVPKSASQRLLLLL